MSAPVDFDQCPAFCGKLCIYQYFEAGYLGSALSLNLARLVGGMAAVLMLISKKFD
ncbi:MAG: hypothetical protein ACLURV_02430 [Gallintestinimicrobium sp.]